MSAEPRDQEVDAGTASEYLREHGVNRCTASYDVKWQTAEPETVRPLAECLSAWWLQWTPPTESFYLSSGYVEDISAVFEVRNADAVGPHIDDHPSLAQGLVGTAELVGRYFGFEMKPILELYIDIEEPSFRRLFVLVRTRLDATEARARMDRLEDEWWARIHPTLPVNVSLDLEFV